MSKQTHHPAIAMLLLPLLLTLGACGAGQGDLAARWPSTATAQPQTAAPEPMPAVASTAPAPTPAPTNPAPELLGGQTWINAEPLALEKLRGKVVVIDFWTYGCINCRNTLPAVRGWWQKYQDQGLVIIGVHTPEFDHEAKLENVQQATKELDVTWPVVQDNDYAIWRAYRNHYWPHLYLIDKQGNIIYDHIGESAYEETERQIQAALVQP